MGVSIDSSKNKKDIGGAVYSSDYKISGTITFKCKGSPHPLAKIIKELLDSQLCFHPSTSCMSINGTRMTGLKEKTRRVSVPHLVIS